MKQTKPKKININVRKIHVPFRVNNAEMQQLLNKAHMYTGGDVSKWVRCASINFKPTKAEFAAVYPNVRKD